MNKATRILVVEDSRFFSQLVQKGLVERIGAHVTTAMSLAEAKDIVAKAELPFNLALVDIMLPDSENGEAVDFLQSQNIPIIVFTSIFSNDLRERLLAQKVIDYVVKDTPTSLNYLLSLVERLHRNRERKVLIVDDSKTFRQYLSGLMRVYQFQVYEAANGQAAIDMLASVPDIRMVITDYHMPDMNGVDMIKRIRTKYDQERLAIIGISTSGSGVLSAEFIKYGANDFINKPFLREEFFCRIVQNVRMLDLVDQLRDAANEDFLTGLKNRRHLFETGTRLYESMKREQVSLVAAMIDIDSFKQINDTYGHDAGDAVLQQISHDLRARFRRADVITRFGGEEFAALVVNMDPAHIGTFFDEIRTTIANTPIKFRKHEISVTASIGVCAVTGNSFEKMLEQADRMLYQAKDNGRNRVEIAWA
ncbi:MAG: diguanylate cyclase [Dongiaceae bacterium]